MTTHHVALTGNDLAEGSADAPLRTISNAAQRAQPGDTIIVQGGIYRERIDPPRGGTGEDSRITFQAAEGDRVEIRGSEAVERWESLPEGLWRAEVPNALFGDFNPFADLIRGDWFRDLGRPHHTAAVYLDGECLTEAPGRSGLAPFHWWAEVEEARTVIVAHFGEADPNSRLTEINVRRTIFYPSRAGVNYITVRGFALRHAATNWAPPTAEQVGAIGTHWSKGWIIEDNTVSHSRCTGITLGKHGDEFDNTSANSSRGYVETIKRAAEDYGWCRENIGGHVVRRNHVHHCEQAGIVGSLGAIFSEITDNHIHDIHVQRLFAGEEQAGIKFHAPIDTLIARNHVHRCFRGIWLDWMSQGTRVSANLLHDNFDVDLFMEVNHGPFVIDNNLMLSAISLTNWSQGGAYVHNLIAGRIRSTAEPNRETPWHPPHDTAIAGIASIRGGGEIFLNNLIVDADGFERTLATDRDALTGSWTLDPATNYFPVHPQESPVHPIRFAANRLLSGRPRFEEREGRWILSLGQAERGTGWPVDSECLGSCDTNGCRFEDFNGTPLRIDGDFFGAPRSPSSPRIGPFEAQQRVYDIGHGPAKK